MFISTHTKVSQLIADAQKNKAVSVLEVGADILSATPPAIIAVAVGYEDMQLLLDATRPITQYMGLNNGALRIRKTVFEVSDCLEGWQANKILVTSGLLETATETGKIVTLVFKEWPSQLRRESLIIVGVGRAHVEALRERVTPALEREQKLKAEKAVTGFADLPGDLIPKREG